MAELTLADALTMATDHFQAGRAEAAAKVLRAILTGAPDCADAHNLLGLTAHKQGDLESALASIRVAVQLEPEDANFHSNLGVVHKSQGALEDAEGCFRRAIALKPDKANFYFNLGQTLYQQGRDRDAAEAFTSATQLRPNYVNALNELGNCLRDVGSADRDANTLARGLSCFDEIASIQPEFRGIAWCRFRVLREQARLELNNNDGVRALATAELIEGELARADWLPPGTTFAEQNVDYRLEILKIATERDGFFDKAALKTYRNARLLPGDKEWFLALDDDSDCIHLTDMANTTPEVSPYVVVEGATQAIVRVPEPTIHFTGEPLFLLGGSRNYYHWMLDYLPRLLLAEVLDDSRIKILLNADRAPFQDECLSLLGIGAERLAGAPNATLVYCEEVWAAPIPMRNMRLDAVALAWLRDEFAMAALKDASPSARRRLYVSRKDASFRRVANEDAVLAALEPLGFEVIVASDFSVAEQIRLFSGAEMVVAPNGAAFANLVFAPPGTSVVELSAGQRVQYSFIPLLCQDCGHDFRRLQCGSVPTREQARTTNDQDHDMYVPVNKLIQVVREVL